MTAQASNPSAFQLLVTGNAEIPHPAERALINVSVSSSGNKRAQVSEEVLTTARHIESLLRPLCPDDESPEAKAAAPLAHWSKTSLSSTSHVPYNHKSPDKELPRVYNASVNFDIRFRDFVALGSFGTKLSSLPHVEVQNINWILTDATLKSFKSQLRKEAAQDAIQKAKDYCDVLGCTSLRPVELQEGDARNVMSAGWGSTSSNGPGAVARGGGLFGSAAQPMAQMSMQRARRAGPQAGEEVQAEDLSFDAQEVKMAMDVTIKFHADHAL
ncbi:hypothetical protein CERZMDRAFT_34928 [Cercospora zeae-maydis SCOH1-5]|uniref:Uncharacterized protein n=1 Tax=Cercospora zeae-maydis SCOH1-5 TaxID=717836 RepID=A0A6A6FS83_9PEZI|nr:hypothetical protein CERZMDRAFT_34928 [Cercospora zeae-maydis SCOH1-5]